MLENKITLSPSSMNQKLKKALSAMALFRGAAPTPEQISLYADRLVKLVGGAVQFEDILAAIEKISDLRREDGHLAFPEVGTIISMTAMAATARHHRETLERDKDLVGWHCPECGIHMSGYISPLDREPRVCRGIPGEGFGICGAIMNEIHRERAA